MQPNSRSILAAGALTLGALLGMATAPASAQVAGGAAAPYPNPYPAYPSPRAAPPADPQYSRGGVQPAAYSALPGAAGATYAGPNAPGRPAPVASSSPTPMPTQAGAVVGYPAARRPEPLYPVPPKPRKPSGWDRFRGMLGMDGESKDADGSRPPRDPSTGNNVNATSKPWLTPLR